MTPVRFLNRVSLALVAVLSLVPVSGTAAEADSAPPGAIETIAGGRMGDGRPGLETHLWKVSSVSADGQGRVYWVENHSVNTGMMRVRRWDPATDRVSTVAGHGVGATERSTDGLPATEVGIGPRAVAADRDGTFYIFETGFQYAIRRVDGQTGLLSTIGTNAFFLPSEGPLEVDDRGRVYWGTTSTVERYDPKTGKVERIAGGGTGPTALLDDQPATQASIGSPTDIEVDEFGNVYFSQSTSIRWVDTQGFIHTLAGGRLGQFTDDGQYGFLTRLNSGEHVLLSRPDRSLWYTDGNRVRRIAPEQDHYAIPGSRRVTTVLTVDGGFADGPLASASFGSLTDLEGLPDGGFLVADDINKRVRRVSPEGNVTTIVGNGLPVKLEDPAPDVYDWTGDGGPATTAAVFAPCGVAIAPDGDVLFTEREAHHKVRRVDAATGIISTVAGAEGDAYSGDDGPATEAQLNFPCGVAVGPDGDVFVADTGNHVVRRVDAATGIITTYAGNGQAGSSGDGGPATSAMLNIPVGVAVDPAGNLFIADPTAHRIRKVSTDGIITTYAGTGTAGYNGDDRLATTAQLKAPRGLAILPNGALLFTDSDNNMIRRVDPDGMIRLVAGTGDEGLAGDDGPWLEATFDSPNGLAYHATTGTIFVADTLNQVVRRLDPDGIVRRVAGNGTLDLCGDGGPAVQACMRNPQGVALTPSGDLVIADLSSLRVRRVRAVV